MRKYINARKSSATLDAILAYVYRKQDLLNRCGRYAENVINGLCELGILKKVQSKKGTFYFSTDKAKNFKAKDFAKEFLLAFHNTQCRDGSKILVFDSSLSGGMQFLDVEIAISRGLV